MKKVKVYEILKITSLDERGVYKSTGQYVLTKKQAEKIGSQTGYKAKKIEVFEVDGLYIKGKVINVEEPPRDPDEREKVALQAFANLNEAQKNYVKKMMEEL